jgi:hypothetical protein
MPSANKRAWAATKRSLTCELGSSHRAISVGKRRALVLSRCLLRWADLVLVQVTLATGCFGTSGAGRPPVQAMMGKTGGRERGRKEIHCMDRNEKEHHRSHTIVWSCEMEGDIESTQLCGVARWWEKKYSYWLSCTHVTLKIPTILANPLVTSRQERRRLPQEWAENSPPRTGTTSKICLIAEYKRGNRRGRGEEVVKRYEKSILGKSGTT